MFDCQPAELFSIYPTSWYTLREVGRDPCRGLLNIVTILYFRDALHVSIIVIGNKNFYIIIIIIMIIIMIAITIIVIIIINIKI